MIHYLSYSMAARAGSAGYKLISIIWPSGRTGRVAGPSSRSFRDHSPARSPGRPSDDKYLGYRT